VCAKTVCYDQLLAAHAHRCVDASLCGRIAVWTHRFEVVIMARGIPRTADGWYSAHRGRPEGSCPLAHQGLRPFAAPPCFLAQLRRPTVALLQRILFLTQSKIVEQ
jgi:hypothetical protein